MLDFCIIGSGISGSTISNLLSKKYSVVVYDKARGYGGRSSFKKYKDKVGFDHGLQYISPKSKKFKTFTNQLIKKKILKKWEGNHSFLHKTVKQIKNHLGHKLTPPENPSQASIGILEKPLKCIWTAPIQPARRKSVTFSRKGPKLPRKKLQII